MDNASESNGHQIADHGWQKVTYQKRQRKGENRSSVAVRANGNNVFRSIEEQSEERRRRIVEAQRESADSAVAVEKDRSDDDDDDDSDGKEKKEKEEKKKKPKKPKVTVPEAAAKIDASDLAAELAEITACEGEQSELTELQKLANFFGKKFAAVSSGQFAWVKLFRESTISKIADIPLSHIPDAVYKTSTDWISQHSAEALSSFVIWCLEDRILPDLTRHHASSKGSKKGAQQTSSKSQVAIFVVLAMVLRRKPDALVNVLPTLRESSKYQGDKVPLVAWMVVQASQGDLAVGLYSWTHNLLPVISGKSPNPQSRDTILQLAEKIVSAPKARTILVNGAVRRGERLIPPSSFDSLMRLTFPASSARVKATEKFEAVYPTLKEVALAGSSGSKAMKQMSQQIFSFTFKAAGEGIPELSMEAAGIAIWCLAENADCYKQWDRDYLDNLNASVVVLKKLFLEWKELSGKLAPFDPLRETIKTFRQKNEKAMASKADAAYRLLLRDAEKYCKALQGKSSHGHGCLKGMAIVFIGVAVIVAMMSPSSDVLNWSKLHELVNSKFSP